MCRFVRMYKTEGVKTSNATKCDVYTCTHFQFTLHFAHFGQFFYCGLQVCKTDIIMSKGARQAGNQFFFFKYIGHECL